MPNYRKRQQSDSDADSDNQEEPKIDVHDLKEIQKLKRPRHGFSATEWMSRKPAGSATVTGETEPTSSVGGGLKIGLNVYSSASDSSSTKREDESEAKGGVPAFAVATNRCDEDRRMQMFIEEELERRKAARKTNTDSSDSQGDVQSSRLVSADDIDKEVLAQVPAELKRSTMRKQEDNTSSTMLSGIPEVDLGMVAKIRNIEQTEAEKQRMLRERAARRNRESYASGSFLHTLDDPDAVSDFVPSNVAVNFSQNNRYGSADDKRKQHGDNAARRGNEPSNSVRASETSRFRVGDFERLHTGGSDSAAARAAPQASLNAVGEQEMVVTLGSIHDNPGAELLEKAVVEKSSDKAAAVPVGQRATDNLAYERFTTHFRQNFRRF